MIDDWLTSIAHADMADWVTVAAYLVAAFLSARAARQARRLGAPRERLFWQISAVLLIFLAVNELLDLQTLLTAIGRAHAKANGWYGTHRMVQLAFVLGLAAASVLAGIAMLWLTRRTPAAVRLALAGLVFIGLFILLRAVSFHHLDAMLGRGSPVFNWGSVQEMAGIVMIASGALLYRRRARRAHSRTDRLKPPSSP